MEKRLSEPPTISVDEAACSRCGQCGKICPTRVLTPANGKPPAARHTEECVLCGQCLCGCPTAAIRHSGLAVANCRRILNHRPVTPESAFDFLSQRRSVRNYKKEAPGIELLEKIVRIAGFAPGSPHHRVGWVRHVTLVHGAENMKKVLDMTAAYIRKIHKLLSGRMIRLAARFSDSAKAGLAVVPDMEMRLNEYSAGRDLIAWNAPAAIFLHAPANSSMPQTDCDAAALYIQLHAAAHGVGTCWNGLLQGAASGDHLRGFTELAEFLEIPAGHKCYAAMTAGFPAIELHSIPERRVDIVRIMS